MRLCEAVIVRRRFQFRFRGVEKVSFCLEWRGRRCSGRESPQFLQLSATMASEIGSTVFYRSVGSPNP